MYVCLCNAVTDRQIRHAVENGATRMSDLNRELGVAGECGKCASCACKIMKDTIAEASSQSLLRVAA